jgi:hypothetical protein
MLNPVLWLRVIMDIRRKWWIEGRVFLWNLLDTCEVGAWVALDGLLIGRERAFVVLISW